MTRYYLCEWEVNGYSDSDWMAIVYDDVTNSCHEVQIGTTRCAYPPSIKNANAEPPTLEIVEKARLVLQDALLEILIQKNKLDILEPNNVEAGYRVQLLVSHRNQAKEEVICEKCNGTGQWVNPKKLTDLRDCFWCRAKGFKDGEKIKTEDGKVKWKVIPAGTEGEVISCEAFGKFYSNGYNQPNRFNRQLKVKLDDSSVINVPLVKCRMAKELSTDNALNSLAMNMSYSYDFASVFGGKFAWYSRNYAVELTNNKADLAVNQ